MSDPSPAVVLRLVPDPLHYGSLAVARTLGRLGVPVWVVEGEEGTAAARSRYLAGAVVLDGATPPDGIVAMLLTLGKRLGRQGVLIPFDDVGALFVDQHADALADAFVFQRQPPGLVEKLLNKWEVSFLAARHDVPTPQTLMAATDAEAEELLARASYPLVLKGAESYLPGTSTRTELLVAEGRDEALRAYREMSRMERANLMFQEYIPGGADAIWMFNGYFDAKSECRFGFTGRKLRQWPPYTGATSLGVLAPNEEVVSLTCRFMGEIGYRGVLDIGYRYDRRDGRYKLLDVNPRVGSTFRLFVDPGNGMDVVRALYLDLTGEEIPAAQQRARRKWIVENRDLRSSLAYGRDGRLRTHEWLRSLRGIDEAAWFSLDDPRPFLAMSLHVARNVVRRVRRKLGGRTS
jgi:predicted ATP-grasp superfamily ATP-dependent carboligase